jgi:hypothetical protein
MMSLEAMSSPAAGPARQVERLAAIYGQVTELADGLTPASAMLPSRTGRLPVTEEENVTLGPAAGMLPLLR